MLPLLIAAMLVVSSASMSNEKDGNERNFDVRLELTGKKVNALVTELGLHQTSARLEAFVEKSLAAQLDLSPLNIKVASKRRSFEQRQLTLMLRVVIISQRFQPISIEKFDTALSYTLEDAESSFALETRFRYRAVDPRMVAFERCMAILEDDCLEGDGCIEGYIPNVEKRVTQSVMHPQRDAPISQAILRHDLDYVTKEELEEEEKVITEAIAIPPTTVAPITVPPTTKAVPTPRRSAIQRATVYLEPGDNYKMTCEKGDRWARVSKGLGPNTKVTDEMTIVFSKVTPRDTGAYVCTHKGHKVATLQLTVFNEKVSFRIESGNDKGHAIKHIVRLNNPVTMYCVVEPADHVEAVWYREKGKEMSNKTIIDGNSFYIENVKCTDAGRYFCGVDKKLQRQRSAQVDLKVYDNGKLDFC